MQKAIYVLRTIYYFFLGILYSFLSGLLVLKRGVISLFLGILLLTAGYYGFIYFGMSEEVIKKLLQTPVFGIPSVWVILSAFFLAPIVWEIGHSFLETISYTKQRLALLPEIEAKRTKNESKNQRKRRKKKAEKDTPVRSSVPVSTPAVKKQESIPTVSKLAEELIREKFSPSDYDPLKDPNRATRTHKQYIEMHYTEPLKRELSKIAGQETAKKLILSIIPKLAEERLLSGKKHKPVAFLLVGKTGVGKTETAKRVAEALKGVHYRFFRIDANQLKTPESVQSLFGAPRGYIGSDSIPLFIQEAVRSGGKMVILIDEIEKAHPDFITAFMTLLDEGEITYNTTGERIKLNDALIFITSNLKADEISKKVAEEKSDIDKLLTAKRMLSDFFPPEILGRINHVIPFEDLKREQYVEIIRKKLSDLSLKNDEETAYKLYTYFKKEGVLDRGVREVVRTLETFALFPDELERVLSETRISVPISRPAATTPEPAKKRTERGYYDPKYGRRVYRIQVGKKVGVFDAETEELIDRYVED